MSHLAPLSDAYESIVFFLCVPIVSFLCLVGVSGVLVQGSDILNIMFRTFGKNTSLICKCLLFRNLRLDHLNAQLWLLGSIADILDRHKK